MNFILLNQQKWDMTYIDNLIPFEKDILVDQLLAEIRDKEREH